MRAFGSPRSASATAGMSAGQSMRCCATLPAAARSRGLSSARSAATAAGRAFLPTDHPAAAARDSPCARATRSAIHSSTSDSSQPRARSPSGMDAGKAPRAIHSYRVERDTPIRASTSGVRRILAIIEPSKLPVRAGPIMFVKVDYNKRRGDLRNVGHHSPARALDSFECCRSERAVLKDFGPYPPVFPPSPPLMAIGCQLLADGRSRTESAPLIADSCRIQAKLAPYASGAVLVHSRSVGFVQQFDAGPFMRRDHCGEHERIA